MWSYNNYLFYAKNINKSKIIVGITKKRPHVQKTKLLTCKFKTKLYDLTKAF